MAINNRASEPFVLTFTVEHGEFRVTSADEFESRCENAVLIIKEVVALAPSKFEGKHVYINFFDYPPNKKNLDVFDYYFCSTRWEHEDPEFLPFPSSNSLAWPQVGIQDGPDLIEQLLRCDTPYSNSRIFWIGAKTHPTRSALVELSKHHPRFIDAEIMEWNRKGSDVKLKSKSRFVSMWDHRQYKYLIDCPGTGYSGRLRWLMATGRPVFIIDRPAIEHWHARMKPWVHYIPVRQDLSDLMYSLKRLESDDDLYRTISSNAKDFVRSNLARGREVSHIADAIANYRANSPI